ncbi:MAG: MFS transporter [Tissierellia bacterium]|nr:MFS transporter [Tissierellia bacterium]
MKNTKEKISKPIGAEKVLSFKNKLGYGLGDFANVMSFGMTTSFLMTYYTDAIGISGSIIAVMFLVARFWDAITDVLMGVIIDKSFAKRMEKYKDSEEKIDKFKPYFKWGAWIVSGTAIMMFLMPQSWNMGAKIGFMYVTYILWGMAYTFVNIPYGSIASVMTMNTEERAELSVARGLGSSVGQQVPKLFVPFVLGMFGVNLAGGYLTAMIILSIVALASYYLCYFFVEENIQTPTEKKQEKTSFTEYIRVILKNRLLIGVALGSVAILAGLLTNGQMMVYYFQSIVGNLQAMGLITSITIIPTFVLAPILPKLVERFSNKKVITTATLLATGVFIIFQLIPFNIVSYIILYVLGVALLNIPMTLVWGMVSDCIDYNQFLTGNRQEGVIYGSYSFVRKIGQALSGFIAGMGISAIGYIKPIDGVHQVQSAETLAGIKFLHIGFTAICSFIAFLAFQYIWNLTEEKRDLMVKAISEGKTIDDVDSI